MMRCRSLAEMPLRCEATSNTARNHVLNGLRVPSSSVPDVRLVWCPQSAHSKSVPLRIGLPTRLLPQHWQEGSPPHRAIIQ